MIVSLWFLYEDGALWCATQRSARTVEYLAADTRCGLEIATNTPPYRGIRGRSRATVVPAGGERVLRALLRRYQGGEDSSLARWLLSRVEDEVAIRIDLMRVTTWDFSDRMGPANA